MSNFTNLPMLAESLRQINEWGVANIQAYAKDLTGAYLDVLHSQGFWIEQPEYKAAHLFGIRLPQNSNLSKIQQALVEKNVFVSYRGSAIRVAVHLWNDDADMEILTEVLLENA